MRTRFPRLCQERFLSQGKYILLVFLMNSSRRKKKIHLVYWQSCHPKIYPTRGTINELDAELPMNLARTAAPSQLFSYRLKEYLQIFRDINFSLWLYFHGSGSTTKFTVEILYLFQLMQFLFFWFIISSFFFSIFFITELCQIIDTIYSSDIEHILGLFS